MPGTTVFFIKKHTSLVAPFLMLRLPSKRSKPQDI